MSQSKTRLKKGGTKYSNIFKLSFVSGAGTFLGIVPQFFVAILLMMVGLYLKNESDETKSKGVQYYGGIALMILGSAMGLGLGSGTLFNEISE